MHINNMNNLRTISKKQLENALVAVKGATFTQLHYVGVQKVKKTGNVDFLAHPIIKKTNVNVLFNGSYENAVNNRLEKSGSERNFVSEPLPWGEWKAVNKTIAHKDNVYVRFYLHKNSNSKVEYWYNGELLEGKQLEDAKAFFQGHSESARQSEAGLDSSEQCKPFTIQIDNVKQVTLKGKSYEIV